MPTRILCLGSHIDWDKITNFREYYWLSNGPQSFGVPGNTIEVESTYTVRIGDNVDNNTYIFPRRID